MSDRLKHILMNGPYPPPYGGIATYIANYAAFVGKEHGLKLTILSFGSNEEMSHPYPNVTVRKVSAKRHLFRAFWRGSTVYGAFRFFRAFGLSQRESLASAAQYFIVKDLVERENIDLIWSFLMQNSYYHPLIKDNFANRIHLMSTVFGEINEYPNLTLDVLKLYRKILETNDLNVASSAYCAQLYERTGFDTSTIKINYIGVDSQRFRPMSDKDERLTDLPTDKKIVLFLGRMNAEMGLDVVIDMMPDVLQKHPDAFFLIVGAKGELSEKVKGLLGHSYGDRIKIHENAPLEVLPEYYRRSRFLLAPTQNLHACMGVSIKEAMCSGIPVIASLSGGIPEAVADGVTGFTLPFNGEASVAPELLRKYVERLLEDRNLCKEMGQEARKMALEKFDNDGLLCDIHDTVKLLLEVEKANYGTFNAQHDRVDGDLQDDKDKVFQFWNKKSCGSWITDAKEFSMAYFSDIEDHRYRCEPDVFGFAQFTRFYKSNILEVGVGAGTDFVQWAKAGAKAHGIDLTDKSIHNTRAALEASGLTCEELKKGDAEHIPYNDNKFDLVYSWGVIHHSPDIQCAFREIVRVTKPGGKVKVMIYNRRSVQGLRLYLRYGLLRFKPLANLRRLYAEHVESPGTKAFTRKEILDMLQDFPVGNINIRSHLMAREIHFEPELFSFRRILFYNGIGRLAAFFMGLEHSGQFMLIEFEKLRPYRV